MIMRFIPSLFVLALLLGGCETASRRSSAVLSPELQALEMIPFMQTGDERPLALGRVRVEKTYWSASGFECKDVTLTTPEGMTSKKLACFEGEEGRFVPSPFAPPLPTTSR